MTSKSKWDWDQGDIGEDYSQPYCTVTAQDGDLVIAEVNEWPDRETGAKHARLIAAAPEMANDLAEANTLFDLCWNAINTAICHEDGLDGKIGETLLREIRQWQAKAQPSSNSPEGEG